MNRLFTQIQDLGHVPVVPLLGYPGVYLNHTTIRENVQCAATHLATVRALHERFPADGQFCLMDLSVEAGALGLPVIFPDMDSPTVSAHPVHTLDDLAPFRGRNLLDDARLQTFVETVRGMAAELDTLVGAYVIGPFSLAGLLMGASEATLATLLSPELVHAVLRLCTDVLLPYVRALDDAGADMIAILEPSGSLLSPRLFRPFCGEYVAELVAAMRAMPILHICGRTTPLLEAMAATGAYGLSLDSAVSLPQAAERLPGDLVLIGNLDTVTVFNQLDPRGVYRAARDLIDAMAPHPNFILSSACDLPLDTPHGNIDALLEAARDART
ncbi:MAG: uroporphyrinogen decarboxylase family protein [Anaerolineales bacterium]